jgi:hypothetical protein
MTQQRIIDRYNPLMSGGRVNNIVGVRLQIPIS